ncbi:MAG: penicillin-binding protein 2, partial [Armatimonadetes bacterium]|nr:penicillin-binding protein 2 [Armatimonadota bacterium]
PPEPEWDARHAMYLGGVGAAFLVFLLRLWYLQVARSEEIVQQTESQRRTSVSKLAPRGLIFDRNGELLAGVKSEIVLTAIPKIVNKNKWVIAKLARLTGQPEKKFWDKVSDANWRPYLPATILVGVPIEIATRVAEAGDLLPGIGVESQPMRVYPDTVNFTHVLGRVWTPNDRDVERLESLGIEPADYVGKDGFERQYESELMGKPGKETMEVDSRGRPIKVVGRDNAVPGSRLTLALDARLQRLANELLRGKKGAAVAVDPSNGEVLCLASAPTYDAALFAGGISKTDWDMLLNDEDHPLINRAVVSSYAPGSTFKVVNTLASVASGVFSESRREYCPGYIEVGKAKPKCLGVHGSISYFDAFARSCNTFFGNWAMKNGPEVLQQTALKAGLGADTGIDLPAEVRGVVPTADYYANLRNPKKWYLGDTVNLGIGQGEMSATPIQMACLASLVANGGFSYRPHLLKTAQSHLPDKRAKAFEPQVLARVDGPEWVWRDLRRAMVGVIDHGTAVVARIPGIRWGGKTGSAEHRKGSQTHSWFIGFAPAENPKIAIAVLVEAAGHGSTVAAPIARDLVKLYLTQPPKPAAASSNPAASDSAASDRRKSPEAR